MAASATIKRSTKRYGHYSIFFPVRQDFHSRGANRKGNEEMRGGGALHHYRQLVDRIKAYEPLMQAWYQRMQVRK